jgi:chromate reductase
MGTTRDVAVLVGSLRRESYTRKIARALGEVAPDSLSFELVEQPPEEWVAFRDRVRRADALLFATPEYNRSVPAALKNAIDVGSRPSGQSVWQGKPGAVVSVSPGATGAFGANHHLRQSFVFLDVRVMQSPEAYIGRVTELLDESGKLTNPKTRAFLTSFATAFAGWIDVYAGR